MKGPGDRLNPVQGLASSAGSEAAVRFVGTVTPTPPRITQRPVGLVQNSTSGDRLATPFPVSVLPVGQRT